MQTVTLIFTAMLPILVLVAAGYLTRVIGWLDAAADRSLMLVVVNLLYPALIFSFILDNEALRQPTNLIFPPLIGFTSVVGGFGLAMLVARRFGLGDPRECRTFAFATGLYNYGYFPIPVIAALFDRETGGVLMVHNMGVEVAMWVLGVGFILSPNDPKSIWRRILSGPVIAILIAVPLNLLGVGASIPGFVNEAIDLLGQCAIPLALLLIGATFADVSGGGGMLARWRIPVSAVCLRMLLIPPLFILFAYLFPFSQELKSVMVIQSAMPCAVFPIVLARHFDGSPEVAVKVVLSTTTACFLTVPLWITFGLWLIGP